MKRFTSILLVLFAIATTGLLSAENQLSDKKSKMLAKSREISDALTTDSNLELRAKLLGNNEVVTRKTNRQVKGGSIVEIGDGTIIDGSLPIEPYYGYTYSQQIYLQSEINTSGNITEVQFHYNGYESWTDDSVEIYIGETTKSIFESSTDWVSTASMTLVFNGTFSVTGTDTWISFPLDTPFSYSNSNNLIIAVHEKTDGYHSDGSDFYCTWVGSYRSLVVYDDYSDPDPTNPTMTGTVSTNIANVRLLFGESTPTDAITSTTTGGNWSETTTWVGGVVPTASDNVVIDGTVSVDTDYECNNLTINSGKIIQNLGYGNDITVNGDLINNGTVRNNPDGDDFDIILHGDLINNGVINNYEIEFAGTADQYISMDAAAEFNGVRFIDSDSTSTIVAASDITVINAFFDFYDSGNLGKFILPGGSGFDLELDGALTYTENIQIIGNGNALIMGGGAYLSLSTYLYDLQLKGTIQIDNDFVYFADDNVVIVDTLQNLGYSDDLQVLGNLNNNGVIRNNPGGDDFDIILHGDLINNGVINNYEIEFAGTADQYISMDAAAEFNGVRFIDSDSTSSVIAASDITAVNAYLGFYDSGNYGKFILPSGSGFDLKLDGASSYTESIQIIGNGNALIIDGGAYLSLDTYLYDLQLKGTVQVDNDYVYVADDNVVVVDTLQNLGYSDDLQVVGTLTNEGVIRSNPAGDDFRMELFGDFVNNGIVEEGYIYVSGTTDQTITLGNSNTVQTDIFMNSDVGTSTYQWYLDGTEITGETSDQLSLDSLSQDEVGTYYCSTDAGNSRNIIIESVSTGPVADFNADVTSGQVPLTVNFTDLSSGTPSSWNWDFGDGSTNTSQNPSHEYSATGTYSVFLTISDGTNSDTETKTDYITVVEAVEPVAGNWSWLHPKPQGNDLYTAYFVDASVGYVGGDYGTLLKTTDGGASWTMLNIDTTSAVHGIHFLDYNVGFITGYGLYPINSFILKTTDGGNSWSELNVPTTDDYNDIFFLDENIGFIVGDYGLVLKTTDGGSAWTEITSNTTENLWDVFFYHSSLGFAVGDDGAVIKTSDGGSTWSASIHGTEDLNKVYFPTENIGFMVGDYGAIYKTVDEGTTWLDISNSTIFSSSFDTYFTDENTGIIVGDGYIHKTTDGGSTWVRKFGDYNLDQKVIVPISATDYLVFGDYGLMMQSTDSGENWALPYGEDYEDLSAIDFASSSIGFAAADGDNVLKTVDGGNTWTALPLDEYLDDVLVIDENTVLAVGTDGDVYKTVDGGQNWTTGGVSGYDDLYAISEPLGNTLYAVGQDTLILKSTDLGDTWFRIPSPSSTEINLEDVYFHDQNNGMVLGDMQIFKTADGGNSWTEIPSPVEEYLSAVTFINTTTGYIAGDDGTVLKTMDGGNTWSAYTIDLPSSYSDFEDIAFVDEYNGLVVGNKGYVYQTSNGGSTWTSAENITDNWLNSICFESGMAYISGYGGTILRYEMETSTPSIAADFSADYTQGFAPLAVQFTDLSTGDISSWSWSFGDGNTSTGQHPSHTYSDAGIYTVSLTISDTSTQVTETKTDYIIVEEAVNEYVSLDKGWNWFSLYVNQEDMSVSNVLTSIADSASIIKGSESFALYDASTGWNGDLDTLRNEGMYMIKMDTSAELSFAGARVDPANTPISLASGWNWISYLTPIVTTPDEALAGINGSADFIKDQVSFSYYYEDLGWYGLLNMMAPTDGYKIRMTAADVLTYPASSTKKGPDKSPEPNKLMAILENQELKPGDYTSSMALTGSLTSDYNFSGTELIKAYAGDELRGIATFQTFPLNDKIIFMMLIYGNEPDEMIRFELVTEDRSALSIGDEIAFKMDAVLGNGLEPVEMPINMTGIDDEAIPMKFTLNQNYPNPFNPSTTIRYGLPESGKVRLLIYDLSGRKVTELVNAQQNAGWYHTIWNGRDDQGRLISSGIYLCQIQMISDSRTVTKQMKMIFMK